VKCSECLSNRVPKIIRGSYEVCCFYGFSVQHILSYSCGYIFYRCTYIWMYVLCASVLCASVLCASVSCASVSCASVSFGKLCNFIIIIIMFMHSYCYLCYLLCILSHCVSLCTVCTCVCVCVCVCVNVYCN